MVSGTMTTQGQIFSDTQGESSDGRHLVDAGASLMMYGGISGVRLEKGCTLSGY